MITITLSSLIISAREPIYHYLKRNGFLRAFPEPAGDNDETSKVYSGHIIIIGMNTLGRDLARRLTAKGESVIAVDTDPAKLRDLPCEKINGDAGSPAVLREAGLERAKLLVSTMHIESTNDLLSFRCRVAGVPAAIHAVNLREVTNLLDMEVAYMMSPNVDGIRLQNSELSRRGMIRK